MSVCAVMSGAEGWEDIEDFGLAKLDWLQKYLPFSNGIPKHDTIARVLSRLNPTTIQRCFIDWVKDIAQQTEGDVIAIDVKSARRSFTTKDRDNPLHMGSAWSCANGIVLGQQKVDDKSNEITAIPTLLDLLDVKGCTVTLFRTKLASDPIKIGIGSNQNWRPFRLKLARWSTKKNRRSGFVIFNHEKESIETLFSATELVIRQVNI